MVNFPTWTRVVQISALQVLFIFPICSTMVFPPLGNSDHVAVSVSLDCLPNSKVEAQFHYKDYEYYCADLDGLCDHLKDDPWEDL